MADLTARERELLAGIAEVFGARIRALEAQVAALAARKSLFYADVWEAGESYGEGDFVTHSGSLWHANHTTCARPGDGSGAWILAVKRGKDGREAR